MAQLELLPNPTVDEPYTEPTQVPLSHERTFGVVLLPTWSRYRGKSVEQVALEDFDYLRFLQDKNKIPTLKLQDRIDSVIYNLNNFEPVEGCKAPECMNPARYLSVAVEYGDIPRGKGNVREGPTGIAVGTEYTWCKKHKDGHYEGKAKAYPIKFDTIYEFPSFPKWVRKDVAEVLFKCAGGGNWRKTRKRLADMLDCMSLRKD